jgi:hypothetical protein
MEITWSNHRFTGTRFQTGLVPRKFAPQIVMRHQHRQPYWKLIVSGIAPQLSAGHDFPHEKES